MQTMSTISIHGLDNVNYLKHKEELIDLYTLSFTEGKYAQYIPPDAIEISLDDIMRIGFGFMAFNNEEMIGAILCLSLKNDPDFPFDSHQNIDPEKTLYIADIMVDQGFRGQGVASTLIEHLLKESESKPYTDVVIRVWDKNIPAVSLYRKLNFTEIDTISQTKLHKVDKKPFEMKKIYMHKRI